MKRYRMLLVVAGLSPVLAASWLVAQERREGAGSRPGGDRRPGGPGMMGSRRPGGFGPGGIPMPRIPDLTAEQSKQITKLREDAMKEIRKIQERMYGNVRKLLNPDQAKAFDEGRRRITHRGPDPGVILTDEQKKVLDEARAEARKLEDRPAAGEIIRKAIEKVRASYSEEQKRQAEEFRRRFGPPRGEGPLRGGPDDRRGGLDR